MEPMMYRKGNDSITLQTTFDASAAKTLQIGGVKIGLPASCFANANGSAYSGTVHADVLNLGSRNANRALMMPGGDLACDKSDEIVMPFGMTDVIFTDNAGNLLKIKDKTDIPISFPAPAGVTDASVPLWAFDEARGVWMEEGSATLQGNVYTGTVSHFCPKAAGKSAKFKIVEVHVFDCEDPVVGANVSSYDLNDDVLGSLAPDDDVYSVFFDVKTNSKGIATIKIPEGYPKAIYVSYLGKTYEDYPGTDPGNQISNFRFNDACNYPEKLAFRVTSDNNPYGALYITYDNYGLRVRSDNESSEETQILISDYMSGYLYGYPFHTMDGRIIWMDTPLEGNAEDIDLRKNGGHLQDNYGQFLIVTDELKADLSSNYYRLPDVQLLGKTCKVYTTNSLGHTTYYIWSNVIIRKIVSGEVEDGIYAITEDVPESAFNMTLNHSWIK